MQKNKDTEMQEPKRGPPKDDSGYKPFENREVAHPTTFTETMFHLLKGSLGTGILAMPNAFWNAGYVNATVGTIAIGIICCYCIHLLLRAQYELCIRKQQPQMTYPNIAMNAFLEGPEIFKKLSHIIGTVVNVFLLSFQLGSSSVYVVFVSSNLKSVGDYYFESDTDVRIYIAVIIIPLILINYVRNLKFLAPFSLIANLITLVTFAIIWYYIFREPISFENRSAWGVLEGYPFFFGTVLFALEAIGIMLPLENEMKNPRLFSSKFGVLNVGFIIITVLYICMGLFGYLKYGDDILGSITLNLPSKEPLAQAVKLLLALAIYVTHALACFVAIDLVWKDYIVSHLKPGKPALLYELLLRTGMVLVTVLFAILIPNLGLFISMVGALCLATLGIGFPAMIQILIHYKTVTGFNKFWLYFSNTILILIGIAGLIVGTALPIMELVKTYGGEK